MTSLKKCTTKKTEPVNVTISMIVHSDKSLELRSKYNDSEIVKTILDSALQSQPILIFPKFNKNIIEVMSTLHQKGIINYNHDKFTYKFLI